MDVTKFNFPKLTGADMAFSCIKTDPKLLDEAKSRKFYNGNTEWNDMASRLFFKGGKLNLKKDLSEEFASKALSYLKSFMGSFEPKHEEKEAICALLLSELCESSK